MGRDFGNHLGLFVGVAIIAAALVCTAIGMFGGAAIAYIWMR